MTDHDNHDPSMPPSGEDAPLVDAGSEPVDVTDKVEPASTDVASEEDAVPASVATQDADLAGSAEPTPDTSGWVEYAPIDPDSANIDAALAAVASLGAVSELDREETRDEIDAGGYDVVADADSLAPVPDQDLEGGRSRRGRREPAVRASDAATLLPSVAVPPMSRLKRGSPGSLIPALALIGVGAWLTFTTTTGGTIDPALLVGIAVGVTVLSLFAYWISSGRWSRGALFAAALIVLLSGIVFVSVPIPGLNLNFNLTLAQSYPLALSAVGLAMLIGGLLARPRTRAAFAPAMVLLAAGIFGALVTLGVLPSSLLELAARLWFVPVVALVIVWLLPLVFRLRDRE